MRGGFAGVVAYLLGYLVSYLWQADGVRESLRGINAVLELFGGEPIPAWQAVGWLFYNAHWVDFTYPAIAGGRVSTNLVASGDAPIVLALLPPLVLLGAGVALASWATVDGLESGARAGAAVTVGYLPVAVVGLFAFRVSRAGGTVAPDPVTGVLLAGVVYPLLFGAVGGALFGATR